MKTTKFTLDFKDLSLKSIAHNSARKAGKSLNQYILDCVLGDDEGFLKITPKDIAVDFYDSEARQENKIKAELRSLNDLKVKNKRIEPKIHADNCPCLMCNPKK